MPLLNETKKKFRWREQNRRTRFSDENCIMQSNFSIRIFYLIATTFVPFSCAILNEKNRIPTELRNGLFKVAKLPCYEPQKKSSHSNISNARTRKSSHGYLLYFCIFHFDIEIQHYAKVAAAAVNHISIIIRALKCLCTHFAWLSQIGESHKCRKWCRKRTSQFDLIDKSIKPKTDLLILMLKPI